MGKSALNSGSLAMAQSFPVVLDRPGTAEARLEKQSRFTAARVQFASF
jgi:hypothetical protein